MDGGRDNLTQLPDSTFDSCVAIGLPTSGAKGPTVEEVLSYLQGPTTELCGVPSVAVWREVYRVLKPGAHVLAFGGTRTFDLISLGLRAAGFENRDTIAHDHPSSWEPILVFRKPLEGTVADNVLRHGTGALNIDATRVGGRWPPNAVMTHAQGCDPPPDELTTPALTPAVRCVEGCPVRVLDDQGGTLKSGDGAIRRLPYSGYHGGDGVTGEFEVAYGDSGWASRFFPRFSHHTARMAWLVDLVTPKNGLVLYPFANRFVGGTEPMVG